MKAPDGLGLVIRIAGLFLVLYGLWNVEYAVQSIFSSLFERGSDSEASPFAYLLFGVPVILVGAVFFFFADWFVKLSYRNKDE